MSWENILEQIGTGRRQDDKPRFDYVDAPPYYLSAYGIAVKHGFVGTEEEWLESLKADMRKEDYDPSSSVEEAGGIPAYVSDAISGKQDTLTFDTTPTQGSANPATSGGTFSAIQNATDAIIHVDQSTSAASAGAAVTQALAANRAVILRLHAEIIPGIDEYVDMPLSATTSELLLSGFATYYDFFGRNNKGVMWYAELREVNGEYSWVQRPAYFSALPNKASLGISTTWTGSTSPYTQTVTVWGATVTASSKVDIQLTATQIAALQAAKVTALAVENNSGTLTLYAFGAKPAEAMTVQCTVQDTY